MSYKIIVNKSLCLIDQFEPEQTCIIQSGFDDKWLVIVENAVYGNEAVRVLTTAEIFEKYPELEDNDFFK